MVKHLLLLKGESAGGVFFKTNGQVKLETSGTPSILNLEIKTLNEGGASELRTVEVMWKTKKDNSKTLPINCISWTS
ncbi:unnamed protein product [Dovyalis caffra]|uniref:Uncharacterized protein n=1 Tax=Dovyalis caffra TaxID=77055 RepID=A0AAV1R1X1_9ROSI|nr:unnamed protein product [Dovyalis caffra]